MFKFLFNKECWKSVLGLTLLGLIVYGTLVYCFIRGEIKFDFWSDWGIYIVPIIIFIGPWWVLKKGGK